MREVLVIILQDWPCDDERGHAWATNIMDMATVGNIPPLTFHIKVTGDSLHQENFVSTKPFVS